MQPLIIMSLLLQPTHHLVKQLKHAFQKTKIRENFDDDSSSNNTAKLVGFSTKKDNAAAMK